jgi:23S rRNA (guanosine2251-2'-O)-methyltransferase
MSSRNRGRNAKGGPAPHGGKPTRSPAAAPTSRRPAHAAQTDEYGRGGFETGLSADTPAGAGRDTGALPPEELLAGKHPVLEALRSGRPISKIWVSLQAQRHGVHPLLEEARTRDVVVQMVDRRVLDRLAPGIPHQGVVAQAAAAPYVDLEELLDRAETGDRPPLLVLLDEVEDPHNLGPVLRTAECAGASGVIIPKRRSAGLTAAAAKASAGAIAYVPVARVSNLAQTIDRLKARGYWVAGADASAPQNVFRADLTGPIALVIGSEGRGLSRLVRDKCDFLVSLPMFGRIGSLNASVAAGIILYEAVRQRQARLDGHGNGGAAGTAAAGPESGEGGGTAFPEGDGRETATGSEGRAAVFADGRNETATGDGGTEAVNVTEDGNGKAVTAGRERGEAVLPDDANRPATNAAETPAPQAPRPVPGDGHAPA